MKLHWKVLLGMAIGLVIGLGLQRLDSPAWSGLTLADSAPGPQVLTATGPAATAGLKSGVVLEAVILQRGTESEELVPLPDPAAFARLLEPRANGEMLWLVPVGSGEADALPLVTGIDPSSWRARAIRPFTLVASIFMALLKMLIVPLVLASIVSGVAGVGSMKDLRRLGGKTFLYYVSTSLFAIVVGQVLVSLIRPGVGAELGLAPTAAVGTEVDDSIFGILERMVPQNIAAALTDNGAMLQIIFFALLLGLFITKVGEPHGPRLKELFESLLAVMMKMAGGVLTLLPYGVCALMVKVVAATGFAVFKPLLLFMVTVLAAILIHALVTLPMLLKFVGRLSPVAWAKAMAPALMTAFSTSSSSMTLPVTMETVEHRGRVSNKVTSFTLPLGATINMDGTALYECIGVIFLAQYYAGAAGYELTLSRQMLVVVMALMASIGAAGIPSAGLVMMLTILSALQLPVEGAALLLAIDRPLDMLRTVTNVWSDSCGAAIIARTEGEEGLAQSLQPVGES